MNRDQEEAAIELWQQRPCLFQSDNHSNAHRHMRDVAYEDIAVEIGVPVLTLKKAFKNLRTQFARLVSTDSNYSVTIKDNLTSHQKWIVEKLDFLKEHVRKRPSTGSSFLTVEENGETQEVVDALHDDEQNGDSVKPCIKRRKQEPLETRTPMMHSAFRSRRSFGLNSHSFINSAAKRKEEIEDKDMAFGRSIGCELKEISDSNLKRSIKLKLMEIVLKAQEGQVAEISEGQIIVLHKNVDQ